MCHVPDILSVLCDASGFPYNATAVDDDGEYNLVRWFTMASIHQYGDHRAGSNKGKVHEVFDKTGKDAAVKKALALDIKESTARTWCSQWGTAKPKKAKKAAPAKTATKKAVKKAAPKKAPAKKAPAAKREKLDTHAAA